MINCSEYDYIEIACMHNYLIKLVLRNGETLEGTAVDTGYNSSRAECLLINLNEKTQYVLTSTIKSIEVLTVNSFFNKIDFQD